jgi:glycosyltransferase involved in cell wall biosynthesis
MMSPELIVLSHLRWTFVWQRPQQLVSRLSGRFGRTWFVEEPWPVEGLTEPELHVEEHEHVTRVWLDLPADRGHCGFDPVASKRYEAELAGLLGDAQPTVWIYTPMALDLARSLQPTRLVYDVMDDLAAFKGAPPGLVLRQRQALREADVGFTGGRSLHRSVVERRSSDVHCFPSGVEPEHYATAREWRRPPSDRRRPVAGYVGVIDERIDLGIVAGLAKGLPDWEIQMVGPVVKIDPATLPQGPNITYAGPRGYAELPRVMAGFDVALMPFALNEATHSISPTKNLEYLAAGLPVVSTRIADVVADYSGIVDLREDAAGFAEACRAAMAECPNARAERVRPILAAQHWDRITDRMSSLLTATRVEASEESA